MEQLDWSILKVEMSGEDMHSLLKALEAIRENWEKAKNIIDRVYGKGDIEL